MKKKQDENKFAFIAEINASIDWEDTPGPKHSKNVTKMKKLLVAFCESIIARVDNSVDFYIWNQNINEVNPKPFPYKFIDANEIEPYANNLMQLDKFIQTKINFINRDNCFDYFHGDGCDVSFVLRGNQHWDYNFLKASTYMSKLSYGGHGCFAIYGNCREADGKIAYTQYEDGNYEDGFMPIFSSLLRLPSEAEAESSYGEYLFKWNTKFKPEMFNIEHYTSNEK